MVGESIFQGLKDNHMKSHGLAQTILVYAGLGGVIGSLAYILTLGGDEPTTTVWEKSLLGTYVLTPEHLTGEEPIRFVGP